MGYPKRVTLKMEKVAAKYSCKLCDYHTSKKSNWNKHISTLKHKMVTTSGVKNSKSSLFKEKHVCKDCNKEYKFKSGLSRHRQKCKMIEKNRMLEKTTREVEMLKNEINKIKDKNTTTIINNINNNLTIKIYLDEKCGNAITIDDFIKSLNISMSDLMNSQKQGFVNGMSNLIIKNLNTLQLEERPIHCSDVKNTQFFIKTNQSWENDNGSKVLNAVDSVQKDNLKKVSNYINENGFGKGENEMNNVLSLVQNLSKNNYEEKNQIIKNIASSVVFNN